MLPHEADDDDVVIVDKNEKSPERPGGDDDDDEDCREVSPVYVPNDEQNVKEVKVLMTKDKVALKIFVMEVPLLCDEFDIITTVFSDARVLRDGTGYIIFRGNTEQRAEVITINDPGRNYHYCIAVQSMDLKEEQVKSSDDCQIVEIDEDDSPQVIPKCPTPKSIDSEETCFEEVSLEGKVLEQEEDEKFHSCLDAENDIYVKESRKISCLSSQNDRRDDVKENQKTLCPDVKDEIHPSQHEKNCEDFFAILSQKEPIEEEPDVQGDDYNDDNEDIVAGAENTQSSNEIHTSKFYSQGKRELNSSSSQSRKTVQLSDSPALDGTGKSSNSPRDTILAVYPAPPARGGITIYKDNYKCLGDGEYLNDVIIDFYLKYLVNEVLSKEDRDRTHVFSSQFYTRLSKPVTAFSDEEVVMTESERRHMGVQRWTKNVNIFEKDFVIVPINEHHHWNLAIICFPGLAGQIFDDYTETLIRPCIMFFDSLSNKNKDRIATILRGYLRQEYLVKTGETKSFSNTVLKVKYPRIPKQSNATDCGLYVLQYVEQFFMTPIENYTVTPLNLSDWFRRSVIKCKRAEIATLVADLARKYHPEKNIVMPTLQFPSDIVSSEEEFDSSLAKIRNPFHKDALSSSDTSKSISRAAGSCASAVSKMKKNDQSNLDDLMDGVRDAPSESDELNLSLDMITFKNSDPIDMTEDDTLMDDHKRDNSLERISDSYSEYSFNPKSSKHKYNNSHKISIIKEDFSGTKSHIFQKSSIFSNGIGVKFDNGARPKRESRTKSKSEQMEDLKNKFQARKRKNELKEGSINEESKSKNFKWIDTSVFDSSKSSDKFSFYAVDDEPGIPASTSYQAYKLHTKRLQEL